MSRDCTHNLHPNRTIRALLYSHNRTSLRSIRWLRSTQFIVLIVMARNMTLDEAYHRLTHPAYRYWSGTAHTHIHMSDVPQKYTHNRPTFAQYYHTLLCLHELTDHQTEFTWALLVATLHWSSTQGHACTYGLTICNHHYPSYHYVGSGYFFDPITGDC